MESPLRLGIIGLDTSHVTAFTRLLNDPLAAHHVSGGRVTAAYAGFSPDWELSRSRVQGFTAELRDKFGIKILPTPQAVAQEVDLVLLESGDGRVHLEQFQCIAPFQRPVFIDKPLANTLADAVEIVRLAKKAGVTMMSCSPLRFADPLVAALANPPGGQPITGVDVFGPISFQPTQPGWFWYGIHTVEILATALGMGCQRVRVTPSDGAEILQATWADGRVGTIRALRSQSWNYGCTLHYGNTFRFVDIGAGARPTYVGLLERVLTSLPAGKPDVSIDQTLEIIRILEAANRSRETGQDIIMEAPCSGSKD